MPTYTYRGDTPKQLGTTTPPVDLVPGEKFTIEETIEGPEYEPVKPGKSTPTQEP